jgi:hypothetical protein
VSLVELPLAKAPPAQASLGEIASTAASVLSDEPGLGLGTVDQCLPFQ